MAAGAQPRGRAIAWPLVVLVLGASVGLALVVEPWEVTSPDAAIYVLTARSLLEGEGYSYVGEPFVLRPPGFPVLLVPVLALFGTSFLALHVWVGLFGIACAALLFVLVAPRLGTPLAFAVAAALLLSPGYQQVSQLVLSDVPGAALALAALVLDRRARAAPPSAGRELAVGLCIAAAAYVRSVNLVLVPALLVSRVLQRRDGADAGLATRAFVRGRVLLLVLVPLVALAPWSVRCALRRSPAPAEQVGAYTYWTAMWHADPADPGSRLLAPSELAARVPVRLVEVLANLGDRMRERGHEPVHLLFGALLGASLVVVFARRRDAPEAYALAVFAVLLVIHGFHANLAVPVFALALAASVEVLVLVLGRLGSERFARGIVLVALAALAVHDFDPRFEYHRTDERRTAARLHQELVSDCAQLERLLEPDARLAAWTGWDVALHLDRPVPSLRFVAEREGLAGAVRLLRERRIDAVLVNGADEAALRLGAYLAALDAGTPLATGRLHRIADPAALPAAR